MTNSVWLSLLVLVITLCCCDSRFGDSQTKVFVTFGYAPADTVSIFYRPAVLNYQLLASSTSHLTKPLSFELMEPTMASLRFDDVNEVLFLQPGTSLHVEINAGENKKLKFIGNDDAAHVNNYMFHTGGMISQTRARKLMSSELGRFLSTYDSLSIEIRQYQTNFVDSVSLHKEALSVIKNLTDIALLNLKLWYKFLHQNNFLADQAEAHRDGKKTAAYLTPPELSGILDEVPFETTFFEMDIPAYRDDVLYAYRMLKFHLPVFQPQLWDKPDPSLPVVNREKILKENYPPAIEEFFLVTELVDFMLERGVTPSIDTVFSDFKNSYPQSSYLPHLQELYNEQIALSPGSEAPDFSGHTVQGAVVSLSDFIGKVVMWMYGPPGVGRVWRKFRQPLGYTGSSRVTTMLFF